MSQTFLSKVRKKRPRGYAQLIASNAAGIKVSGVYRVINKDITDPEKILKIEEAAQLVWEKFYAPKVGKSGKKRD